MSDYVQSIIGLWAEAVDRGDNVAEASALLIDACAFGLADADLDLEEALSRLRDSFEMFQQTQHATGMEH